MRLFRIAVIAALGSVAATSGSWADFPEKDVRAVVPWGAGGGADAITRKFMSIVQKSLGGTIYVDNIEGGISSVGVNEVMKSRPDGYTIGSLTYDSVITVPWKQVLPGYDLSKLKILAQITSEPNALIVSKGKYDSYAAFIEAAKAAPGKLTIGVHGLGSMPHLTMLQLEEEAGVKFRVAAYPDGAAGQKEALLSGEIDAAITSLGDFAPLLEADQADGLLEFSETANPTFSTVPISADVGLKMKTGSFLLIAAPANIPDDVAAKLETSFETAFKSEEFQSWTAQVGVTPSWTGVGDVTEWMAETQRTIFGQLDALHANGVIEK